MKHTPGPWKTEVCGTFKHLTRKTGAFSITAGEKLICQFPWARTTGQMVEESEANAHLIAAAPELLEVLDWLLHLAHGCSKGGQNCPVTAEEWTDAWGEAQAAIAKAKGAE